MHLATELARLSQPCGLKQALLFSVRTGQERCWARIVSSGAEICVPHRLWLEHLSRPSAICGDLFGSWREYSPLSDEGEPKQIFSSLKLAWLPAQSSTRMAAGMSAAAAIAAIERVRESVSTLLKNSDPTGALRLLLLGETTPGAPTGLLRMLGFSHLLNASGLHLYALAWVGYRIGKTCSRVLRIPPEIALPILRLLCVFGAAWAWLLCGARPGMLRPLAVIALNGAARALGFRFRKLAPLFLVLAIEIAWRLAHSGPLLSPGGIFYALALAGALFSKDSALSLSLSTWVATALFQIWQVGTLALLTPLISLITIPVFTLLLYPSLLLFSCGMLGGGVLRALSQACGTLIENISRIAMEGGGLWIVSRPALIEGFAVGTLLLAFGILNRASRWRTPILIIALTRIAWAALGDTPFPAQVSDVIQLDVGQGDSALVVSKNARAGLIDAGSAHALSDPGWIELFARRGVTEIDWTLLTHLDEDHRGGLDRLSALIPIGCVSSSSSQWKSDRGQKLARELAMADIPVTDESGSCVPFPVRYPQGESRHRANAAMSGILVPLSGCDAYLSAGDAEGADEIAIARWAKARLRASTHLALKISHHGSKTSTETETLRLLHPMVAIISDGVGNRYGHPHAQTLRRLTDAGIPIYRTDELGAISVEEQLRLLASEQLRPLARAAGALHPPREHPP